MSGDLRTPTPPPLQRPRSIQRRLEISAALGDDQDDLGWGAARPAPEDPIGRIGRGASLAKEPAQKAPRTFGDEASGEFLGLRRRVRSFRCASPRRRGRRGLGQRPEPVGPGGVEHRRAVAAQLRMLVERASVAASSASTIRPARRSGASRARRSFASSGAPSSAARARMRERPSGWAGGDSI